MTQGELRTGNLIHRATGWKTVNDHNNPVQEAVLWSDDWECVDEIGYEQLAIHDYPFYHGCMDIPLSDAKGIELTEDILVNKFEFVKSLKTGTPIGDVIIYSLGDKEQQFKIMVHKSKVSGLNTYVPVMDSTVLYRIEINTVHHLQNAYYVLMNNQELIK